MNTVRCQAPFSRVTVTASAPVGENPLGLLPGPLSRPACDGQPARGAREAQITGVRQRASGELPSDLSGRSLRGLAVLTDTARRKLVTDRWDTEGPWRLRWTSCGSDVTELLDGAEGAELSGRGADEAEEASCYVTVQENGDAHTVEVLDVRVAEVHVTYEAPVPEPDGVSQDTETQEVPRNLLERAAEQVREAGYEIHGDWTVSWTECRVLLAD